MLYLLLQVGEEGKIFIKPQMVVTPGKKHQIFIQLEVL